MKGRTLKSLIAEVPLAERVWVEAKGREMGDDMIRYAEALADERCALDGLGILLSEAGVSPKRQARPAGRTARSKG